MGVRFITHSGSAKGGTMGFRLRKSIRVGKAGRINLSKSGVGGSVGGKGFRVGAGPSGGRMNVGIPGTGIGYEARIGNGRRAGRRGTSAQVAQPQLEPKKRRGCGCIPGPLVLLAVVLVIIVIIAAT
jgi:hypothetical protein